MEEEVSGEESGGSRGNECSIVENRKREKNWAQVSDSESDKGRHQTRKRKEEYKVLMKFASESGSAINPLKNDEIRLIESAQMLRDRKLLLFCKDNRRQKRLWD